MDVFTMVVIVVIVGCGSGVLMEYFKNQRIRSKQEPDADQARELAQLRERIEVLEKIVTDERYDLSRELNRLERRG